MLGPNQTFHRKLPRISTRDVAQGVLQVILMWNKDQNSSASNPATTSAQAVRPSPVPETRSTGGAVIGATMKIKGDVFSSEELQIDGEVIGKLETKNRLTIGVNGKADANIKANEVVVAGTVKGNVEATERIVLRKGANLVGDVKTSGIVIEDGAYFRGGIDIARPEPGQAKAANVR